MKSRIIIIILVSLSFFSCKKKEPVNILFSFEPHRTVAKEILRENARILSIIPHQQKPFHFRIHKEILPIYKNIDYYFILGLDFEKKWANHIMQTNPDLQVVNISKDIELREYREIEECIEMIGLDPNKFRIIKPKGHHGEELHVDHEKYSKYDIYTWMNPLLMKKQMNNLANFLLEKENLKIKRNLDSINDKLEQTAKDFIGTFKKMHKQKHITGLVRYLGYVADAADIAQLPYFTKYNKPNPGEISGIISQNMFLDTRAFFFDNQFTDREAEMIEEKSNTAIIRINPYKGEYFGQINEIISHCNKFLE